MEEPFLFVFGLIVTLVVVGAVGSIWWAAINDGRTNDALARGEDTGLDATASDGGRPLARAAHQR